MKTDEELQKDVQDALKWEPLLNSAEIGVTSIKGVITLTGLVDSFSKKTEAEDATKKVTGVKAIVEKIEVKFNDFDKRDDIEIANEILNAFNWNSAIPNDKLQIKVEDGWVTLEGELFWNYQSEAALKSVKNLLGVKGVKNYVTIITDTTDEIEKKAIEHALTRNSLINAKDILVEVSGNKVTLNGTVSSLHQRDEAQRIASNAPGVISVNNELLVEYKY